MVHILSQEQLSIIKNWLQSGSINIFGLPFAGKDTHGALLAELLDAPLIGGGEILRNSAIPPRLKKELDAGILLPINDFLQIVTPYLSNPKFEDHPLILSSVGRWIGEERGILQAAKASGHPMKAAIYLLLNEHVVHERWEESQKTGDRASRSDDAEQVLDRRIQEFREKTLPVIEIYRQKGLLIEVDSEATRYEVTQTILARLLMFATNHA